MARWATEQIRSEFIAGALAGLAAHGEATDVEFGRKHLYHTEYDVRVEAVRVVSRFGGAEDYVDLIKLAKSTEGLLQEMAVRAALNLATDRIEAVRDLIETGNEVLISIAICELIANADHEGASSILMPLLYSDNDKNRIRAMIYFAARCAREELEQILVDCAARPRRYYDVVCFFDRVLYAPPRLRKYFLGVAEKQLFDLCKTVEFGHLEMRSSTNPA
jgi:hypothetical protein